MNWLKSIKFPQKIANTENFHGYKIVAYDGTRFYSLYSQKTLNIQIGQTLNFGGEGLFLGTTKEFCTNYYSGGTDDQDALITFEYSPQDLIKGDPHHHDGEVQVTKAKIVNIELLPKED